MKDLLDKCYALLRAWVVGELSFDGPGAFLMIELFDILKSYDPKRAEEEVKKALGSVSGDEK